MQGRMADGRRVRRLLARRQVEGRSRPSSDRRSEQQRGRGRGLYGGYESRTVVCHEESYGEMIGCDNSEDCSYRWVSISNLFSWTVTYGADGGSIQSSETAAANAVLS